MFGKDVLHKMQLWSKHILDTAIQLRCSLHLHLQSECVCMCVCAYFCWNKCTARVYCKFICQMYGPHWFADCVLQLICLIVVVHYIARKTTWNGCNLQVGHIIRSVLKCFVWDDAQCHLLIPIGNQCKKTKSGVSACVRESMCLYIHVYFIACMSVCLVGSMFSLFFVLVIVANTHSHTHESRRFHFICAIPQSLTMFYTTHAANTVHEWTLFFIIRLLSNTSPLCFSFPLLVTMNCS